MLLALAQTEFLSVLQALQRQQKAKPAQAFALCSVHNAT
jgi:hypothetical protein